MPAPANYKQVIQIYEQSAPEIQNYFRGLPKLIEDYDWIVPLSFVFARIETVKHTSLHCGLVKLHELDTKLTRSLLDKDHMSRSRFRELFKVIFAKNIPDELCTLLADAEAIRDKAAHGKVLSQKQAREGLAGALSFAKGFNEFVKQVGGFHPFGDLRGFKGAARPLKAETTRWVLKGMGIPQPRKGNDKYTDD